MSLAETFAALSDPQRQKILKLLQKSDLAVADILKHLPITGASLSHHLNVLKNADLVSSERRGQQVIYSLNLSVFEELMQHIASFIK